MIPYDDLVIALQTWRAKQGLPVGQLSGQLTPPPAPARKQPSGPTFSQSAPPPLQPPPTHDEALDVEGHLIEEAHEENYEPEGNDFAMAFGGDAPPPGNEDSTSIGSMPEDDGSGTEVASPAGGRSRGRGGQQDW